VTIPGSDEAAIAAGARALAAGDLVAFPTETVYGLGADALSPQAVSRVFTAKGRPPDHPLICHVADAGGLALLVAEVTPDAHALAQAFWPGPLTIILPRSQAVPDEVTGGRDTVAVRIPDHPLALALLEQFGGPVAAPSANRFGRPSPTRAEDVTAELGRSVAVVLDGGPCTIGIESTVLDLTTEPPQILRPGGIGPDAISAVIGRPVSATASGPARAPGMLESHYAPGARVEVVGDAGTALRRADELTGAGQRVGLIAPGVAAGGDGPMILARADSPDDYAAHLYAAFRRADAQGLDVIIAVPPPATGIGVAVRDRLARAAAGR
jgi:L-threonylcarbamoyladenylate synthase